jgi:general stress protein 26
MDIPYYKLTNKEQVKSRHGPMFPKTIFCVIAGATGSGKTNLIVHLLTTSGLLDYSNVYIYAPTLYQDSYEYLKDYYNRMEKKFTELFKISVKIAHFFEGSEEIKDPKNLNANQRHVMIFDDVMNADQTVIKDYFCRGRHNNVNVFYLCQSLHKIQKHCIRENANVFVLFHQDDKTLKYFYETHISGDMEFKEFKELCNKAWSKKYGFIVINLWEEPYCGRYLINYGEIYTPSKYLN